jgi:hypothetical protein
LATTDQQPWGRVDETGTVFVREGESERAVGQYPDGTPEEALAYFERKFTDLAGQVTLLEQRARRGAPASDIAKAVAGLRKTLDGANAVGDLASLATRLDALGGTVEELTEQQSAEAKAAVEQAVAERTSIVESHQHDGPRIPKNEANELWKRFRAARSTIEHNRKAFFADLDNQHRDVRARKTALIEQAEALIPRGADGVPEYRQLLDQWKLAGRAGKRNDDALWAKFKAAGDAIYSAKAEVDARDNVEYQANLELKLAILEEAEPLLKATDRESARNTLISIQQRWDEIGRVPREQVRPIEDRLRKIEAAVRKLDEDHWERNNPEKKARSEGLASQLNAAIAKLQQELDDATASGDARKVKEAQEALDARKVWLDALQ